MIRVPSLYVFPHETYTPEWQEAMTTKKCHPWNRVCFDLSALNVKANQTLGRGWIGLRSLKLSYLYLYLEIFLFLLYFLN